MSNDESSAADRGSGLSDQLGPCNRSEKMDDKTLLLKAARAAGEALAPLLAGCARPRRRQGAGALHDRVQAARSEAERERGLGLHGGDSEGMKMKDTNAIDQERQRRGDALAADMRDAISFPPLPPSPAEVGDLILQTREHVQSLGWGNREQLYTASQVRAVMSECAAMAAARERERHADALRCALEALDYCLEDSAELLSERTTQWGSFRKDRQTEMAAALERHRAVAERLRALLVAP